MISPLLLAAALLSPPPSDAFVVTVEETVLGSGLHVVLAPDHAIPGVAVALWFDVGSADEAAGRTGFAHLFEHLMFMGSTHAPYPAFDELMEQRGAVNNATTTEDATWYYENGPSNVLPLLLWLEADRLWTLPEQMSAEKVKAQRLVVQNERRQRYENRPYGAADLALPAAMYPSGHPYSWPVMGSHADLEAASDEDVRAFFSRHYVPSNASLAIAGDFDPREALTLVERYFGWMPRRERPPRPEPMPPGPVPQRFLRLPEDVAVAKVVLAWRAPPRFTREDAALKLAAKILVSGKSGRLYRSLVYEARLASQVTAELRSRRLGGIFAVEAVGQPGHEPAELAGALDETLSRLAREGPSAKEVETARTVVLTELAGQLQPLVSRALLLNWSVAGAGSAKRLPDLIRLYQDVTPDDVRRIAADLVAGGGVRVDVVPRARGAKP